jgi:hypothetical protein
MSITIIVDTLSELLLFAEVLTSPGINTKLDRLTEMVSQNQTQLLAQGTSEMALIDDLEGKVASVQGTEDSVATLLATIHDELVAANANNPRIQAVIDSLSAGQAKLVAAVVANPDPNAPPVTPPAP